MKATDYQKNHSAELAEFLVTKKAGQHLIQTLASMRPPIVCKPTEHETVHHGGKVQGFEDCISAIILLTRPPQERKPPAEATYEETQPKAKKEP